MYDAYHIINANAKNWWYHKQLRKDGKVDEARMLERKSIRSTMKNLRDAQLQTIGRGGRTMYFKPQYKDGRVSQTGSVQGYQEDIEKLAIALGIPTVDSLTVSDNDIYECIKFPMYATSGRVDSPPYGSLSWAPIIYVAKLYEEIGATLYNMENVKEYYDAPAATV